MVGVQGLNPDFTGRFFTAGAAGHLADQLCAVFHAAEVRAEQTGIGIQNHHHGHIRKMVPFGQHLCAGQNARPAVVNIVVQVIECLFGAHGITVHPAHREIRE